MFFFWLKLISVRTLSASLAAGYPSAGPFAASWLLSSSRWDSSFPLLDLYSASSHLLPVLRSVCFGSRQWSQQQSDSTRQPFGLKWPQNRVGWEQRESFLLPPQLISNHLWCHSIKKDKKKIYCRSTFWTIADMCRHDTSASAGARRLYIKGT